MEGMCDAMDLACDEAAAAAAAAGLPAAGSPAAGLPAGSGALGGGGGGVAGVEGSLLERVHVLQAARGAEIDAQHAMGEGAGAHGGVGGLAGAKDGAARLRAACTAHGRDGTFRRKMVELHERQLARYAARGLHLDFHGAVAAE